MKQTLFSPAMMQALKSIVRDAVKEAFVDNEAQNSMLTSEQICSMLGISRTTLWRLQTKDGLPVYHLPKKRGNLYKMAEVKALINADK